MPDRKSKMQQENLIDFNSPMHQMKQTGKESFQLITDLLNQSGLDLDLESHSRPSIIGQECIPMFKNTSLFKDVNQTQTAEKSFQLITDLLDCSETDLERQLIGTPSLIGKDSLQLFQPPGDLDVGRESLGILPQSTLLLFEINASPNEISPVESNSESNFNNCFIASSDSNFLNSFNSVSKPDISSLNSLNGDIKISTSPEITSSHKCLNPNVDISSTLNILQKSNYLNINASQLVPSCSSISSLPSIASSDMQISKIYNVSTLSNQSHLNNAFIQSSNLGDSKNRSNEFSANSNDALIENIRKRFQSLPTYSRSLETDHMKRTCRSEYKTADEDILVIKNNFNKEASRSEYTSAADEVSTGSKSSSNEEFNDSVFIEARHLASKLGDGSILEESFEGGNLLDNTSPPEWDSSDNEDAKESCSTEAVFKTVDKLLPPAITITESTPANSHIIEVNSVESMCNENTTQPSLTNTAENCTTSSYVNISQKDCSSGLTKNETFNSDNSSTVKSQETKKILQDLFEIVNNDNRDDQQKSTAQNLLFNLVDILYSDESSKANRSPEDSENIFKGVEETSSAIEQNDCCEALDLSMKRNVSEGDIAALDLSIKSDKKKWLSQSFSFPSPKFPQAKLTNNLKAQMEKLKKNANDIEESNTSPNKMCLATPSSSIASKLKSKIAEIRNTSTKKGPMKAVIPVNVMAKGEPKSKPEMPIKQETSLKSKSKRTSTPIKDSKLKPMAQSTPENQRYSSEEKNKSSSAQTAKRFSCPVSPVGTHTTPTRSKTTASICVKRDVAKPLVRRSSASDLKSNNTLNNSEAAKKKSANKSSVEVTSGNKIRRSNSTGKENLKPAGTGKLSQEKTKISSRISGIKPFSLVKAN